MNAEPLVIQRAPVSHICSKCNRRNILIFPNAQGALTWSCVCGNQWQINFRKVDTPEHFECDTELRRTPMDHGCTCTRRDVIVLPMGSGELRWRCAGQEINEEGVAYPCRKIWRIQFNEKTGEIYEI